MGEDHGHAAMPERARPPIRRVAQWATGNVGRRTVEAIVRHPELQLVGAFAYSPDKVGVDVGELCGLDALGVAATDDVEALLDLRPDCVVYTPLHFDLDEVSGLLARGVNVVTSAEFLTGGRLGEAARDRLQAAAERGQATLFGSGMNPGFAQLLAAVVTGVCMHVRHVRVTESFDLMDYASDSNMDDLGWGLPGGAPGHADAVRQATTVFADGLDVLADLLGVELDEHRCTVDFSHAIDALDLPGRPIPAGHVAGMDVQWEGIVDGRPVIEFRMVWAMGSRIEPTLAVDSAYTIEVDGEPKIRTRFEIWPHQEDWSTLTTADFHGLGMVITGVPVVNAIPAVCDAAPGIATYRDLPTLAGRGRVDTGRRS